MLKSITREIDVLSSCLFTFWMLHTNLKIVFFFVSRVNFQHILISVYWCLAIFNSPQPFQVVQIISSWECQWHKNTFPFFIIQSNKVLFLIIRYRSHSLGIRMSLDLMTSLIQLALKFVTLIMVSFRLDPQRKPCKQC